MSSSCSCVESRGLLQELQQRCPSKPVAAQRGALEAFPSVRQARLWEGWLREHRRPGPALKELTFHRAGQEEDRIRQAGSLRLWKGL